MSQTLIIVESPTKAKTISKFLGNNFTVRASFGHIRDLPESAADIPAKFKKEKWARLGINVENNFEPLYVVPSDKKKVIKELKDLILSSNDVILATDEDREGEAISWHLQEVLALPQKSKRIVFHEITNSAIEEALKNPRTIDMNVVQAQETRRILDRLVGYTISPLLWKKIAFGLSAGRVQSVAVKIVVARELERMNFKVASFDSITGTFEFEKQNFDSKLVEINSQKVATSKDFGEDGKLLNKELVIITENSKDEIINKIKAQDFVVTNVEKSEVKRNPAAPYITSSLQIDANRKLGFSSKQTMQVAQKLYELGYITYMRTDSVNLSDQALFGIKNKIEKEFGANYWAGYFRKYKSRSKNAQEAHEAIRPAGNKFSSAQELGLEGELAKLYDLIWKRTLGSQMKEAIIDQTSVDISSNDQSYIFHSTGSIIKFDGFLKLYNLPSRNVTPSYKEGNLDDSESEENQTLPELQVGNKLDLKDLVSNIHETKPPARYNDASLVKKLEEEGIGRPSTYASIISTIQSRGYISRLGNQLVPTYTAFAVDNLLQKHFGNLVDLKFTSAMEDTLDEIETGNVDWLDYLKKFYLGEQGLEEITKREEKEINPRLASIVNLPNLSQKYKVRVGKFGAFVNKVDPKLDSEKINFDEVTEKSTIPNEVLPADLTDEKVEELLQTKARSDEPIAKNSEGEDIFLKSGRFGAYLKVGDKNYSIPKGTKDITPELALKIIELPRLVGKLDSLEIRAGFGKFGPYLLWNAKYTSIPEEFNLFDITEEQAIELIKNSKTKSRSTRTKSTPKGKDLGMIGKKKVILMDGKYGPYLKFGTKNFKVPKDVDLEKLDLEVAKNFLK
ncbi:type I DNA topoisomerase [bacterium]|nr:MAG: type I DNA topoisomerase [bacterium]